MAKPTTVLVTGDELEALFDTLGIWDKIRDGLFDTRELTHATSPAKSWPGGTSYMLSHHNSAGAQACTTHRIIDIDGVSVHWDASNIRFGDVTVAKAPRT